MRFTKRKPENKNDQRKLLHKKQEGIRRQQERDYVISELQRILAEPNVRNVIAVHEQLLEQFVGAQRNAYYEMYETGGNGSNDPLPNEKLVGEELASGAVRVVGIRRMDDEPLGMTVREEDDGRLVVARVITGGLADLQGLLHVDDEILEVNGHPVSNPLQLQDIVRRSASEGEQIITFKIFPSFTEPVAQLSCHMRALFNYDPSVDSLLPCKEIGLAFVQGDILEILNQEDANWWQARKVDSLNPHQALTGPASFSVNSQQIGLVPSQELEEKRRAFVRPEFDYASKTSICGTKVIKKKKKSLYAVNSNSMFDNAELVFYEEMCKLNRFQRKCLVLIGASGVGIRFMKQRLIQSDPDKYASVLPTTSRPPREGEVQGRTYLFTNRESMEHEISENMYLEYGEFQGHLYGTRLESIREVMDEGKICILDCNPQSLKLLKTPEFMPYIVFLGAPPLDQLRFMHDWGRQNNVSRNSTFDRAMVRNSRRAKTLQSLASFYEDEDLQNTIEESNRILRIYEKYFDLCLVNYNFEQTFQRLLECIHSLENDSQWVPISWVLHGE